MIVRRIWSFRGRTFGGFTSVKRGVDEVRREREEGRTTCDINVDHAANSGVEGAVHVDLR